MWVGRGEVRQGQDRASFDQLDTQTRRETDRQGRSTGNVRMKHASFIVDTAGRIRAVHYARYVGDHADIPGLIRAYQAGLPTSS